MDSVADVQWDGPADEIRRLNLPSRGDDAGKDRIGWVRGRSGANLDKPVRPRKYIVIREDDEVAIDVLQALVQCRILPRGRLDAVLDWKARLERPNDGLRGINTPVVDDDEFPAAGGRLEAAILGERSLEDRGAIARREENRCVGRHCRC